MIQLYTGNGKGKTTAAIGLAIRAAGSGLQVYIAQFIKGMPYGELKVLQTIPHIHVAQFGRDCFIKNKPTQADIVAAENGWTAVENAIASAKYKLLILDELCIALHYQLLDTQRVYKHIQKAAEKMEVVITGRYASNELIALSDLVTEMKAIKHYYNHGIEARKGIEY